MCFYDIIDDTVIITTRPTAAAAAATTVDCLNIARSYTTEHCRVVA